MRREGAHGQQSPREWREEWDSDHPILEGGCDVDPDLGSGLRAQAF